MLLTAGVFPVDSFLALLLRPALLLDDPLSDFTRALPRARVRDRLVYACPDFFVFRGDVRCPLAARDRRSRVPPVPLAQRRPFPAPLPVALLLPLALIFSVFTDALPLPHAFF